MQDFEDFIRIMRMLGACHARKAAVRMMQLHLAPFINLKALVHPKLKASLRIVASAATLKATVRVTIRCVPRLPCVFSYPKFCYCVWLVQKHFSHLEPGP